MYADRITPAMQTAIDETNRRREKQIAYNEAHQITPQTIQKEIYASIEATISEAPAQYDVALFSHLSKEERVRLAGELQAEMIKAAESLEFERAAELRDMIKRLLDPPRKAKKRSRSR